MDDNGENCTLDRLRTLSKQYDRLCDTEAHFLEILKNLQRDAVCLKEAMAIDPNQDRPNHRTIEESVEDKEEEEEGTTTVDSPAPSEPNPPEPIICEKRSRDEAVLSNQNPETTIERSERSDELATDPGGDTIDTTRRKRKGRAASKPVVQTTKTTTPSLKDQRLLARQRLEAALFDGDDDDTDDTDE